MRPPAIHLSRSLAATLLIAACLCALPLDAQTLEVLHAFQGPDGSNPASPLVLADDGHFYGTTRGGGDPSLNNGNGYGTIFRMTLDGTLTTLVYFDGSNGAAPEGTLVVGGDGNLYGATSLGGDLSLNNGNGSGTVFKMTPEGNLTTLVTFDTNNGDATNPGALSPVSLALGSDGNFYGTTGIGGDLGCSPWPDSPFSFGCGTMFRMTPSGALTTLVNFSGFNGSLPVALLEGPDASLYGITLGGGTLANGNNGGGTIFKMTPDGSLRTLHSLDCAIGGNPTTLILGKDGNFYGTTDCGGDLSLNGGAGSGTIFKMAPGGSLTRLATFNGSNGSAPRSLIQGSDGNLYGTTEVGGDLTLNNGYGDGAVFRVIPGGQLTTLVSFNKSNHSFAELLVQGSDGNLYGTTTSGGDLGFGTIFRVVLSSPGPALKVSRVNNFITLSWPTNAAGFGLQSSSDLSSLTNWTDSATTPAIVADQYRVTNTISSRQFYRLKK